MKKTYQKPEIMFEDFSLSTNIAAGCEKIVGNHAKDICGVPGSVPGLDLFIQGVTGCFVWSENDDYDGHCYHNPTEYNDLFNS